MNTQALKLLPIVVFQCLLLLAAQMLLKVSVEKFGQFSWTWTYFKKVLTTPIFGVAGLCAIAGTVLWMWILKRYDFSLAYPLTSLSYVFSLFASVWFFHEQIPLTRWIGVVIIVIGVFFVVK